MYTIDHAAPLLISVSAHTFHGTQPVSIMKSRMARYTKIRCAEGYIDLVNDIS